MPPVDEDREASLNLRKAKNEDILRELIVPPPLLDYLWARIRFRWARLRYENTIRTLIALAEQKSRIYCKPATENDAFIQAIKCLRGIIGLDEGDRPETDFATIKISKDLAQINYRVHYDLACYYSKSLGFVPVRQEQKPLTDTEKEHLRENGFFHLEMALTLPGDLNNYARKDADLDNLRTYQAGARFNAIVDSHVQAAKAAPTNALLDLSKLLEILSEQADIDNLADLLRHGAKPDRRRKLVWQSDEKLTYAQVTRWVRIADLMRLDGMGLTDAELLYEAGISSPQLLAGYKYADLLHEKLVEVNGDKKLVKTQVPTERMLADWIRKASQLKDVVV